MFHKKEIEDINTALDKMHKRIFEVEKASSSNRAKIGHLKEEQSMHVYLPDELFRRERGHKITQVVTALIRHFGLVFKLERECPEQLVVKKKESD